MEKVWEIPDPEEERRKRRAQLKQQQQQKLAREEKDPSKAYTLSTVVWGLGQLYTDQVGKGATFMVLMLLFTAGTLFSLFFWDTVLVFLVLRDLSLSGAFLDLEILLFCALILWTYNAGDAYHQAAKMRKTRFRGVSSRVTPLLCSFLVPGWGQYLNGQPVKGGIYRSLSVFGIFFLISVPAVILAWPYLENTDSRFIVEEIFAVSVLGAPLLPLLWAFSVHDAFKVSRDDLLKEPLGERLKAAYYRGRTQGWVRGIFPQVKGTFVLVLFLAFFVIVVYYWFPKGYYVEELTSLRSSLGQQGMTIVPELIGRLLDVTR
jgi:TM2 domain-containing membrane protein YozV